MIFPGFVLQSTGAPVSVFAFDVKDSSEAQVCILQGLSACLAVVT